MIEKNGIRIDALILGDGDAERIEMLVRCNGVLASFTLKEVLDGALNISKDYGDLRAAFARCCEKQVHQLTTN
jgi:hypothetical protein